MSLRSGKEQNFMLIQKPYGVPIMISDPTLLVVDDEQVYCDGCERIFSRQGFRVEGSNDAAEALNLATNNDYSAIILDVKMPNMDGIRFLEYLRATKPDTPVILMTGYPSIQNAASAGPAWGLRLCDQTLHARTNHLGRPRIAAHRWDCQRRGEGQGGGVRFGRYRTGKSRLPRSCVGLPGRPDSGSRRRRCPQNGRHAH